jgi:hypothetical protein
LGLHKLGTSRLNLLLLFQLSSQYSVIVVVALILFYVVILSEAKNPRISQGERSDPSAFAYNTINYLLKEQHSP